MAGASGSCAANRRVSSSRCAAGYRSRFDGAADHNDALYAADFPVPRPYVLCEDDEVIGTAFYVMEYVDGRIFWELDLPGIDPDERAAIYDNVNDTIARNPRTPRKVDPRRPEAYRGQGPRFQAEADRDGLED